MIIRVDIQINLTLNLNKYFIVIGINVQCQHKRIALGHIYTNMAIMWTTMTYEVDGLEIEVHFFIRHDVDTVLSFKVTLKSIVVDYHMHTEREDFADRCLTVITVTHVTTSGVQVSLTWT